MLPPLDLAFKYTDESISKCKQLADFLKKRQEIEDEYAKALRKLCKSVSLKPLKKQGWFARATKSQRHDETEDEIQTLLLRSNLWSTFYETVDDTSQIAKSHGILAESLSTQLISPFEESIKTMEMTRKRVHEESNAIDGELLEAASVLRKARQQLEDSTHEVNAARLGLSRIEGAITMKPKEVERARAKYQAASDRLTLARSSYRQCDEVCRALQLKVGSVDVPRLGRLLLGLETARGHEVRQLLQQCMKLDRVAAEMDVQCTGEMEAKVAAIVLDNVLDSLVEQANVQHSNALALQAEDGPSSPSSDPRRYSISRPLASTQPPPLIATPQLASTPMLSPKTLPPLPPNYYPPSLVHSNHQALRSAEQLNSKQRQATDQTQSIIL